MDEREELGKRVKRQNMIIAGIGIVVIIIYIIIAYLFRDLRFPLPTPLL